EVHLVGGHLPAVMSRRALPEASQPLVTRLDERGNERRAVVELRAVEAQDNQVARVDRRLRYRQTPPQRRIERAPRPLHELVAPDAATERAVSGRVTPLFHDAVDVAPARRRAAGL